MSAWQFANQFTSNSSGNLEDITHPQNLTKVSLPEDSSTLPLERRHFNLPWHLRQGQYLGVFHIPCALEGLGIGTAANWTWCLFLMTHPTAQPPARFHPRGTAFCAPVMPGNVLHSIPVVLHSQCRPEQDAQFRGQEKSLINEHPNILNPQTLLVLGWREILCLKSCLQANRRHNVCIGRAKNLFCVYCVWSILKAPIVISLDLLFAEKQEHYCSLVFSHTHSFYPFSWCYAHCFPAPLGPKASSFTWVVVVKWGVRLNCQHLQSFPGMNVMFTLIFLLSFSRICFGLFFCVFQHASIPSLFPGLCTTYYVWCPLCMLDTNFVLSVTTKPSFSSSSSAFF